MSRHSQESWTKMQEEWVCESGRVKVRTALVEMNTAAEKLGRAFVIEGTRFYFLFWPVERL